MTPHPVKKLLDLAQAARQVQEDASADNINAFESLIQQMVSFEAQAAVWEASTDIPLMAHIPLVRGGTRTKNGLSIGSSLVFQMEESDLTISIYRENVVGSLMLQCDVNHADWVHAAALLYQSDMLVDTDWVDREGEFTLRALAPGEIHIKLRAVDGRQVVLSAIEIEP